MEFDDIDEVVFDAASLTALVKMKPKILELGRPVPRELQEKDRQWCAALKGFSGYIMVQRSDGMWYQYDEREGHFEPALEKQKGVSTADLKGDVFGYIVPEENWTEYGFKHVKWRVENEPQ